MSTSAKRSIRCTSRTKRSSSCCPWSTCSCTQNLANHRTSPVGGCNGAMNSEPGWRHPHQYMEASTNAKAGAEHSGAARSEPRSNPSASRLSSPRDRPRARRRRRSNCRSRASHCLSTVRAHASARGLAINGSRGGGAHRLATGSQCASNAKRGGFADQRSPRSLRRWRRNSFVNKRCRAAAGALWVSAVSRPS